MARWTRPGKPVEAAPKAVRPSVVRPGPVYYKGKLIPPIRGGAESSSKSQKK